MNVDGTVDEKLSNDKLGEQTEAVTALSNPVDPTLQRAYRKREYVQLGALFWCMFLAGWNDGTTGPLLPRIESVYNVNYTVVSLLFVLACVGFVSGALLNMPLTPRLGFGRMMVIGATCQVVAYTLQSPALPFPAFIIAYAINGVGMAIQDAQTNGYVVCLKESAETKMGLLHAVYGVGALCSPLVSTQFAYLPRWSFHFLVSLGVAIINLILILTVFRFKTQDECLAEIGHAAREKGTSEHSEFRKVLGRKTVHFLALFILVYVGVEVTIGGWTVTYIINERGGGKASGYISSGFFGGLTLGRVALLWVNKKVGERRVLFIYSILAIGLEIIVWRVPHLVGDAVAVSFVGFFLGPMYPIVMNHSSRILPPWILTGAIGWIAGLGQAGSALFPFITGALAQKYGIESLQPLLIAMMGFMMVLWALVPNHEIH
ncbi:MFS general substrate transporter [Cylindrobasidium torrendii FP15055 ss-10]|uniref:MFS general substrate transporter n=1 Tax=Cylindrobasidium torrendii FP15055 ss-10 TaxID=1314674 RepID=A0A0D7BD36_9AGAR|nr:MFS general substrate transporter [Cylindrobasidium torrendii FP15055 ss-10]